MTLAIKNMVCDRCLMAVAALLANMGLHPTHLALGTVALAESSLPPPLLQGLAMRLQEIGFELLMDRDGQTVEQLKTAVIALIHHTHEPTALKHSTYLANALGLPYAQLSKLFREREGITLEHYLILQRIERVKEWLSYGELTLSEIAWRMGYSSVAALSTQFKKETGNTPTAFRQYAPGRRKTLDRVA